MVMGSGSGTGAQVLTVVMFIFAMLAVFEVTLLGYVIAPAKTQAVLEPVHEWARTYRSQILLVLFAVVGIWQLATGLGII
jgi:hypothetical protein